MADLDSRYLIGRAGNRELWRVMRPDDHEAEAIIGWRVLVMPDGTRQPAADHQVFRSESAGRDWLVSA